MEIYDSYVNILEQALLAAGHILDLWVNIPVNATGPLDPNVALTDSGATLVQNLASIALSTSSTLCVIFSGLFPAVP